ncbi:MULTISPECIES: HD domain-containing protein [unclassified Mesorhizobium]|uniref:HD domain-containing protein n=1 Tax=unclassified Mesorhizobium TaxID=325217 RepID=UPI00112E823B|nr:MULTISPECIES: HD domain-containing protein [unclassified Mesorhizobium]MBZ9810265.1 HD domain-containing protein [Mesorhizobium sp. ESP-6-2]TPM29429.1 HD domain-containing protein [Mesorhizobium sp. B2-2-2]
MTADKINAAAIISGVRIPDSKIAREVTEFIRDTESDLLFNHSARVYLWGALTGNRMGLSFDPELFYAAAMFHDIGLTQHYGHSHLRFEVDGANAARDFLRQRGISDSDVHTVWNAIALHTTPGIPEFMRPEIALVQAGAGMDVAGRDFDMFTIEQREAVTAAFPREANFKLGIIDAFYEGMKHRPETTFGTFNDDILAFKDPHFRRIDICSAILSSNWAG